MKCPIGKDVLCKECLMYRDIMVPMPVVVGSLRMGKSLKQTEMTYQKVGRCVLISK